MADDDIPDSLDNINLKINQTTDESLESSRRMKALCEEAKETGIKTLVMLDDQGEQLEKIEGGLANINSDMKEAEEHLKGMEGCCMGLCKNPFEKGEDFEKNPEYMAAWQDPNNEVVTDQPRVQVGGELAGPSGGYITKITEDAREDEMDENLQAVSGMVGNLRNMAVDMGGELSNQNKQLDKINAMASSNTDRVAAANQRASKLAANA